MRLLIQLQSTAPLLMHNIRLANPRDEITKKMKLISSKQKKTEEDLDALAKLEFMGSMYWAPNIGLYVPSTNVEKAFIEGARLTKAGKKVERGFMIGTPQIALVSNGVRHGTGKNATPLTPEELWNEDEFVLTTAVRVMSNRVMRTRPMFAEWKLNFNAELDIKVLDHEELIDIIEAAGSMIGLCDFRPKYGRFELSQIVDEGPAINSKPRVALTKAADVSESADPFAGTERAATKPRTIGRKKLGAPA
jgi:hypothetical protein